MLLNNEKFKRLRETFGMNFRITQLYALYLERCPEIITKEMVDLICEDGSVGKEAALVALLSEMFGIDIDKSREDRRLIREYLTPSVRILGSRKYTENPYYKNIRIDNVKDGDWELKHESYKPYRGVICGDMELYPDFREVPPLGFFEEEFFFPAVLEGGNEWMTLTPVDLDTSEEAIEAAHGKVVTFGLGLGYYAYMVSEKETVDSVTVVEKSAEVIRLFERYILPQFPNRHKVRVINEDAFAYAEHTMPTEGYDVAFVDTWRDASDGAPMYERMKRLEHLSPHTRFLYWIESFLISRHRALIFTDILREAEQGGSIGMTYEDVKERLDNPLFHI